VREAIDKQGVLISTKFSQMQAQIDYMKKELDTKAELQEVVEVRHETERGKGNFSTQIENISKALDG
jgi:hypothetical protein